MLNEPIIHHADQWMFGLRQIAQLMKFTNGFNTPWYRHKFLISYDEKHAQTLLHNFQAIPSQMLVDARQNPLAIFRYEWPFPIRSAFPLSPDAYLYPASFSSAHLPVKLTISDQAYQLPYPKS